MPIRQKTSKEDINAYIERRVLLMKQAMIRKMMVVGEKVINQARTSGNYKDQTGNLRSSVGYVIISDGIIIQESSFEVVGKGVEGSKSGKEFAERLARQHSKGLILIVVAGMKYAKYVSARGYDVIDSAELLAQKLVPKILDELGLKK